MSVYVCLYIYIYDAIIFSSSPYRFTVFGACTYDMVMHKSENIYEKLQLSVFIIAGSYYGFLLNAGHVRMACYGHHGTYKDLRDCDYIVSIRVSRWVSLLACRRPREEKEKIGIKQHPII